MSDAYEPLRIEGRWRDKWEADGLYQAPDDDPRPKWYALTMFPYTSGDLHIGHWYAMAPSDVHARFKRMQGYNVLFPMGFDAFGLPAENAAISHGIHPYTWTMNNIENMRRQLRTHGRHVRLEPRGHHLPARDTTSGRSGSSSSSTSRTWPIAPRRRSTGAPSARRCWPTSRWSADGVCERCGTPVIQPRPGAVVLPHHQVCRRAAATTRHIDWPERIKIMQTQLDRQERRRRDLLRAGPSGRRREGDSGSSPPVRIPSSASPSWCWRRSIRWWPS